MMKKLNWDFLRRDRGAAMALESTTTTTKPNGQQKLGTNRWSSESRLMHSSADVVSRNCCVLGDGGQDHKLLSNKSSSSRLSFSDLLLRRTRSDQVGFHHHHQQEASNGKSSSKSSPGILDSLKRRFRLARSEHSRMNKRHSLSQSISSIVEETNTCSDLPKSRTSMAMPVQVQQTCRLCPRNVIRGSCCDIHSSQPMLDPLSEHQDDQQQLNDQVTSIHLLKCTFLS